MQKSCAEVKKKIIAAKRNHPQSAFSQLPVVSVNMSKLLIPDKGQRAYYNTLRFQQLLSTISDLGQVLTFSAA